MLTSNQNLPSTPIRIVIADEDPDFRRILRQILTDQPSIEILTEANDTISAAASATESALHVLLLDYSLCLKLKASAGRNGGGVLPTVRKIAMVTTPEKANVIGAFRLGAQGIVLKGSARPIWLNSIAAVAAGQYWLGNESLAVLVQAICESPPSDTGPLPTRYLGLTRREIEIIQKIADGRSNKEVGQDFSIRERTVKHHLTNIFGKVGVSSRLELALFARDHKITMRTISQFGSVMATTEASGLSGEQQLPDGPPDQLPIRKSFENKKTG